MLALSITLLVFGMLPYFKVAEACDSEIRVWVPTKKDNRFLNLSAARVTTNNFDVFDKVFMSAYNDVGVKTDTHLCVGLVHWHSISTAEADPEIVLMNSVTTFPLSGGKETTERFNATCTLRWNGEGGPPCDHHSHTAEDNEDRLNWYVGEGTDLGSKPLWQGIEIVCSGEEDLRSL